MGVWGPKVLEDDAVLDVYQAYLEKYDGGTKPAAIRGWIFATFGGMLVDPTEGPAFWLGLAKAQHECGTLDDDVLRWAEQFVESGADRERWPEDQDGAFLRARKKHLTSFLKALQRPRARPRRPGSGGRRRSRPVYEAGDCLAVRLPDGDYGAALVLASRQEGGEGENLVGALRYKGPEKPPREVFEVQDWLTYEKTNEGIAPFLVWCLASHHGECAAELERIGQIQNVPRFEGVFPVFGWRFSTLISGKMKPS